ncbi:hypothetical protein FBZ87_104536 [Nitrospirillum amazonense]|uniref:Uncharacterized protein n=1 Tax=Nitrospirillum amazonense TaxID=28077 RepID=A0A560K474_9PROT|nr:hypothetical protein [Nitrospirillum amazonense]TWB75430.1 hypothetical protein FBZ87_104536 [Nitrospirillum amazonense]
MSMRGAPRKGSIVGRAAAVWAILACGAAQAQDFVPPQSTGDIYLQGFIGGALVQQRQGYYRRSDGNDDVGRSVYGGGGLGYAQRFDNWLVGGGRLKSAAAPAMSPPMAVRSIT